MGVWLTLCVCFRDTMDSVKQSAALCLLRLYKTSPDLVLMGEWTSRVVHLLNDQHMVGLSGNNKLWKLLCRMQISKEFHLKTSCLL